MVEFGLKLEDNKVSDWSEHYIHYEKLKAILKKCGVHVKKLQELSAKRDTKAIMEAYKRGVPTPQSSNSNLEALEPTKSKLGSIAEGKRPSETTELNDSMASYGSNNSVARVDSTGNLISRAFSGVTDYFSKSFERSVRDLLKEIDKCTLEFDDCLRENIVRVNSFYAQKLEELEERVAYLKESVSHLRALALPGDEEGKSSTTSSADNLETPLLHTRKSVDPLAFARKVAHAVQTKYGNNAGVSSRVSSTLALLNDLGDDQNDDIAFTPAQKKEAESIQRALVDHYRTAKLLQNFAIMNYTGFVKIVKKFDKTSAGAGETNKGRYKKDISPANICNEGKAVELLANRMEQLYANWFCDKDVSEARAQMLTKKGDGLEMDWSQLRLGYRMGMCTILALWVCWDCIWGLVSEGRTTIGGRTAFPVFRACGGLLTLQWCWGFSVWVWTRYRVNYIYLFEFNPSIVASPLAIFNEAVDNTLVYLVTTLLYYKAGAHQIPGSFPAGVFPFLLVLYTTFQLIFPLKTRTPMWENIWHVVTSPTSSPTFFHGYVGDVFTSLVKVFQDLAWTGFFVFSGDWMISEDTKASTRHTWSRHTWYTNLLIPLLTLLPLWFRFNQCLRRYTDTGKRLPHLANAFKYALSQTVTLFGAFHPLYMRNKRESDMFQFFWMFAFVASSLYSFWWDLYMDWGLGQLKHNFLGPRLMYPKKSMYYGIMCLDLVLRFAWVLTLLPPKSGAKFALPAYLTLVSMMLEIFRRTIWGFLRLENEHRSNTAGFRRVDFVPLHFATGHDHGYKKEEARRGYSVVLEVAGVTILVLAAATVSVVAAQHATQRMEETDDFEL